MSINNNSNNYNYSGNLLQLQDGNYTDATIQGQGSEIIINNNAVNFAKMQNIDTNRLLGRSTVGTGTIEQITVGSGLTLSAGTLSASGGGGGGAQIQVDTITTSGTWTKPTFAKTVKVYCLPGGGGGGSGARGNPANIRTGGGGGSSTGYSGSEFLATSLTSTVTVTIGAGGSGGASISTDNTDGLPGIVGGATSFGSYVITQTNGQGFGGNRTNSQSTSSIVSSAGISTLIACSSFQGRAGTNSDGNLLSGEYYPGLTMGCGGGGAGSSAGGVTTRNGGFFNNQLYTNTFGATNGAGGTNGNAGGNGTNNLIGYLYYGTGGGGGSFKSAQATGNGGNGGYGAGGGGGAGSDNLFNSGAGGSGGNGLIIIVSEG
jgi:hypothetical protein